MVPGDVQVAHAFVACLAHVAGGGRVAVEAVEGVCERGGVGFGDQAGDLVFDEFEGAAGVAAGDDPSAYQARGV